MRPALALLATLAMTSAQAEFVDGNSLLADMNGSGMRQMAAIGYVMGVSDAYGGVTHCAPGNATAGQMRDMVKNFLDSTPAVRHLSASSIVSHVLKTAWPCAEGRKGAGV